LHVVELLVVNMVKWHTIKGTKNSWGNNNTTQHGGGLRVGLRSLGLVLAGNPRPAPPPPR